MPNLKVLPNRYQKMMEQTARIRKAFNKESTLNPSAFTGNPRIEPIYHREGHYKLGNREWLEFTMPDGTFEAVEADDFEYEMDRCLAYENAMDLESFEAMKRLVKKGFLPESKQYTNEIWRREDRKMKLEARVWGKGLRTRLKVKIAARKAEKTNVEV